MALKIALEIEVSGQNGTEPHYTPLVNQAIAMLAGHPKLRDGSIKDGDVLANVGILDHEGGDKATVRVTYRKLQGGAD